MLGPSNLIVWVRQNAVSVRDVEMRNFSRGIFKTVSLCQFVQPAEDSKTILKCTWNSLSTQLSTHGHTDADVNVNLAPSRNSNTFSTSTE